MNDGVSMAIVWWCFFYVNPMPCSCNPHKYYLMHSQFALQTFLRASLAVCHDWWCSPIAGLPQCTPKTYSNGRRAPPTLSADRCWGVSASAWWPFLGLFSALVLWACLLDPCSLLHLSLRSNLDSLWAWFSLHTIDETNGFNRMFNTWLTMKRIVPADGPCLISTLPISLCPYYQNRGSFCE